jgi:hypothetical protein
VRAYFDPKSISINCLVELPFQNSLLEPETSW